MHAYDLNPEESLERKSQINIQQHQWIILIRIYGGVVNKELGRADIDLKSHSYQKEASSHTTLCIQLLVL